jgi:hypothetical protein
MNFLIKAPLLSTILAFSATTLATDYTQYCPALDQLHVEQLGPQAQLYAYMGINNNGVTLKANTDDPQYIFPQQNTPSPRSIDSGLTTYIAISHTLRCDYTMINVLGYPVNYPLYNHDAYNQCANGNLVLAGQSCN